MARRVSLLVNALDGAQRTNEALAACANGEDVDAKEVVVEEK